MLFIMNGFQRLLLLIVLGFLGLSVHSQPKVYYTLKIDTADLSGYEIEMLIQHPPSVLLLAMATHHEYDDRYWRYVESFRVQPAEAANWKKVDSAVWKIDLMAGNTDLKVSYRIHLPIPVGGSRASQRPFLTRTGGLVGDLHSFMYMVGYEGIAPVLRMQYPAGWQMASGLKPGADSNIVIAPDMRTLLDCPILIGRLQTWNFMVNGITHQVAYWALPAGKAFDTFRLTDVIRRIVGQAIKIFGKIPYRNYAFLMQDGAYGALEHLSSVTVGAPSSLLATNMEELYGEIAHEYFHTWNLMGMRPAEYSDLNYGPQEQSTSLWWSEGLTMFYADLLLRRAGLPAYEPTRIAHLEALLHRYYSEVGNWKFSPEKVSLSSESLPGPLGDYDASVHLQGELIGVLLDLIVRDATNGKRSMDDVMRGMFDRFSGKKGFYGADIEQVLKEICGRDLHTFFETYVRQGKELDFNRYLSLIGLHVQIIWMVAKNEKGQPAPDRRIYVWHYPGDSLFRLAITNPESCWGKAGLHTGDLMISFNGQPITGTASFFTLIQNLHIGDTVQLTIKSQDKVHAVAFQLTQYQEATAEILPLAQTGSRQNLLLKEWNEGK
jgi:predicted metalloprotease with PDZ domain